MATQLWTPQRQQQRVDRDSLTRQLLARFSYAEGYRRQWEDKAIDWYKLYIGWREELPKEQKGRSNLHIPRPYEQLDALRARIVKSFFATRPYVEFIAKPDSDAAHSWIRQSNDRKAEVASALVDEQLEKNAIYRKWYDYVTCFLIYPLAIMSVGWRYEERPVRRRVEVPMMFPDPWTGQPAPAYDPYTGQPMTQLQVIESVEPIWDDNELQVVDFFDWWGDPKGWDIDSCRFVFQRELVTWDELQQRQELLHEHVGQHGGGTVFPLNKDDLGQADNLNTEGKWQRLSAVGLAPDTGGDQWDEGEKPGRMYELLHYWTDTEHGFLVNRQQLAYYGESPYWRHGKKPYVVSSFDPLPNELYGMSAMQIIEHLSHELDTMRNQRVDNVSMVLNRMWLRRTGSGIADEQLVSRPHGIIDVDDLESELKPLEMGRDVTPSSYNEESIIKSDMENALGVAPVTRGVGASRQQTATEVMNQTQGAAIRFDVKISLYQFTGFQRMVELMDMNNQQFIDKSRLVRLYGEDDAWEWVTAGPGEIVGEYDYRPAGANVDPSANKEIRRQQLTEMMEAVWKLNIPYFNRYKLSRLWAESFDLRNVDGFMLSEEELQQMMMMQQLMAQQQGMGGMPGPMGPGGQMPGLPPGVGGGGAIPQPPAPQALGQGVIPVGVQPR